MKLFIASKTVVPLIRPGKKICEELIEKIIDLPCIHGVHLMGPNCESGSAEIIAKFK
jgi:hypothetical protein